jgi:hypothetical protein
MDIFFQDPSEVPLPPDEVRLRALRAEPYPDGRRVHVFVETDPFQQKPSLEVTVTNAAGQAVAQASVVETPLRKLEFTLHLRPPNPGLHTLTAVLFYSILPSASELDADGPAAIQRNLVDKAQITFEVPVPAS